MTQRTRPLYRYLEPLDPPAYGSAESRARWAVLLGLTLFVLVLALGFLAARAGGP